MMIAFPQIEVVPSSEHIPRGRRWISTQPTWHRWLVVVAVVCVVHVWYPDGIVGNVTYRSITCGAAQPLEAADVVALLGQHRMRVSTTIGL